MTEQATGNLDPTEAERFEEIAATWWDPDGPMKPLHDLNPARVQYLVERANVKSKDVLDVGCGGGILSEAIAARGGKVTGIDVAEKVVNVAKLHLHESGLEVDYQVITVEQKTMQCEESFDVVACMEMLEHVPDPASVVQSIEKVLRPGGDAFFSTLNRTPLSFVMGIVGAEYVARICPRGTHRYDRFIRPSELSKWIRTAGMEVVEVCGIHYNPLTSSVMTGGHVQVNYLVHARKPPASTNIDSPQ